MLTEGFLFGASHSKFDVEGNLGTQHRANVWPIEQRLYDAAQQVDWDIARLDEAGRLLLEIAWRTARAHEMSLRAKVAAR
jgi:hypothetical protein